MNLFVDDISIIGIKGTFHIDMSRYCFDIIPGDQKHDLLKFFEIIAEIIHKEIDEFQFGIRTGGEADN